MIFINNIAYTSTPRSQGGAAGFTLVETLVAVALLLTVIVGPLSIAQKGLQTASHAGDQVTAIYLAQEGIEHIQMLRDNVALDNYLDYIVNGSNGNGNTTEWYDDLPAACKNAPGCDVNYGGVPGYKNCATAGECNLEILSAPTTRVYGYGVGTPSPYTRTIFVGNATNGGYPVTVKVSWAANAGLFGTGVTKEVILQTYVYDHYARYE